MKNRFKRNTANALYVSALAVLGSVPLTTQACAYEPIIGSVCTVAFNWCPDGYLPAYGQSVNISQYNALYSLIGITYGGDGKTTFALPDLRGRVVAGVNPGTAPNISPLPLGQKDGNEKVQLSANNLPPHTHPTSGSSATASGTVTLPLDSVNTSITSQKINGTITVNAITTATSGASGTPSSNNNTIGRIGSAGSAAYYGYDSAKAIAVPTTNNLSISGGTVSGNAKGDVSLPITGVAVAVGNNVTTNTPVPTIPPRIALTACIAHQGIFPTRP